MTKLSRPTLAFSMILAAGVALPQYLMLMTPYLATLAVMVWVAVTNLNKPGDEPGALGLPFVREERR